jgi:hypothetical protein
MGFFTGLLSELFGKDAAAAGLTAEREARKEKRSARRGKNAASLESGNRPEAATDRCQRDSGMSHATQASDAQSDAGRVEQAALCRGPRVRWRLATVP